MPFIRSLVSKYYTYVVAVILLLNKIMPTCFYCVLKGLIYIAIIAPLGRQPSFYTKCTKLNMRSSYNVRSVSNTKYMYLIYSCILRSLRLPYLICLRVSCDGCCKEARL